MIDNIIYFFKYFLMGGLTTGLYSVLLKVISPSFSILTSTCLPFIFSFLIFQTHELNGKNIAMKMCLLAFFSVWLWQIFVLSVYFCLKMDWNIINTLFSSLIVFIISSYIFYMINNIT
jgi:hypothetical protein